MTNSLSGFSINNLRSYVSKPKKTAFLAGWFLLIIFLLGIFYFKIYQKSPYYFTYQSTKNYVLSSTPLGMGMSFDQPTQFEVLSKDTNQVETWHNLKSNNKAYTVGYIAASRSFQVNDLSADDLVAIGNTLKNPTDSKYAETVANFEQFVSDRVPVDWTVKYSKVSKFSNSYITKNAWTMDFVSNGKNSNPKGTKFMKGKAVMALTSTHSYYFMVMSVDYNWKPNMKVWDKSFNSLKIEL